jgi:aryl-alcohol dehydrogenase-like predicted oxidoreductase
MFNTTSQIKSRLAAYRQLAPQASVRVSPLCLGAMQFGDKDKQTYGEMTKETSFAILNEYYDAGGNFIDTANIYQHGQSEEWLAEWMATRGNRDEIVLATKYVNTSYLQSKDKILVNYGGTGSKSMKVAIDESLARLKTHYIDLYYVHYWDYTTSIPELMHSLNDLVVAGKVLYLGISDTPAWIVSKANEYARGHGLRPFVVFDLFSVKLSATDAA